jgi:hypothetical protein
MSVCSILVIHFFFLSRLDVKTFESIVNHGGVQKAPARGSPDLFAFYNLSRIRTPARLPIARASQVSCLLLSDKARAKNSFLGLKKNQAKKKKSNFHSQCD